MNPPRVTHEIEIMVPYDRGPGSVPPVGTVRRAFRDIADVILRRGFCPARKGGSTMEVEYCARLLSPVVPPSWSSRTTLIVRRNILANSTDVETLPLFIHIGSPFRRISRRRIGLDACCPRSSFTRQTEVNLWTTACRLWRLLDS